ncbi:MAG: hypothetical protein Tsb009_12170 [Planctomycetaceae bacterium]
MQPVQQILPLEFLQAGETGWIAEVDGDEEFINRLAEMGCRQGTRIRMIRPGTPCIIAVENHRLSFRGDDAALIFVAKDEQPDSNT